MSKSSSGSASTILQVAAQAGLSIATVSRVLNGGKYVSAQTRERVLQAARELNYQPNYMARQLHGANSFVVAIVLGLDLGTISPFALKVYEPLKMELEKHGYRAKRAQFDADGKLLTQAKAYIGVGLHHEDPRFIEIQKQDAPYISIGDKLHNGFWVASNDQQGGYLATDHVLNNGCRSVYFVCLHGDHDVSRHRYHGYREAMIHAGLVPTEAIELTRDTGMPALDSYRRIRKMLELGLKPDAFVAFSDMVATGISMALADCGYRVPEDVQVVGYDGMDDSRYDNLTTVKQDIQQLAIQGAELTMQAIRREPANGISLDVSLRKGDSSCLLNRREVGSYRLFEGVA